jgi:hypothetical protein
MAPDGIGKFYEQSRSLRKPQFGRALSRPLCLLTRLVGCGFRGITVVVLGLPYRKQIGKSEMEGGGKQKTVSGFLPLRLEKRGSAGFGFPQFYATQFPRYVVLRNLL